MFLHIQSMIRFIALSSCIQAGPVSLDSIHHQFATTAFHSHFFLSFIFMHAIGIRVLSINKLLFMFDRVFWTKFVCSRCFRFCSRINRANKNLVGKKLDRCKFGMKKTCKSTHKLSGVCIWCGTISVCCRSHLCRAAAAAAAAFLVRCRNQYAVD